jgi:hypothetical protein
MASYTTLPDGYTPCFLVDLKKDKRLAALINLLALLIAVLMAVAAAPFVSPFYLFIDGSGFSVWRAVILMAALFVYIVLHELTHGVAMRLSGTKRVRYGFDGLYAFAGSDDYYTKGIYLFIALAPVVLFGAVLFVLMPLVPREWFWVVYGVQITNLSGAAGDLYVTARFLRLPRDILVRDAGSSMTVYRRAEQNEE